LRPAIGAPRASYSPATGTPGGFSSSVGSDFTITSNFLFIFIIRVCRSSGLEFLEALLDGGEGALRGLQQADEKNNREREREGEGEEETVQKSNSNKFCI